MCPKDSKKVNIFEISSLEVYVWGGGPRVYTVYCVLTCTSIGIWTRSKLSTFVIHTYTKSIDDGLKRDWLSPIYLSILCIT